MDNEVSLENHPNIELTFDDEKEEYIAKYKPVNFSVKATGDTKLDAVANLTDALASSLYDVV